MRMTGRNVSITQFVLASLTKVDRPLRDKTGMTGKYDFTFEFAPPRIGGGPDINASEPQPGMTFKDAIQERLGLKLVPRQGAGHNAHPRSRREAHRELNQSRVKQIAQEHDR